jgi:hypothetical protein
MSQQVVVTTDVPVALKPLLTSAIQAELRLLELGLARTSQRLSAFEEQYGLTSDVFERRFMVPSHFSAPVCLLSAFVLTSAARLPTSHPA